MLFHTKLMPQNEKEILEMEEKIVHLFRVGFLKRN